ncbi:MAG: FliM/FliN family flagellar motor switch protein [Candidatus Hydrogenedentes bacterium]|nr:FliM/FliN family flagellar motor switch protein [Candidatus Hydrogenedentota bacterium]
MTELIRSEAQDHAFEEVDREEAVIDSQHLILDDLRGVQLGVDAVLGRSLMTVREILDLQLGSIVQLDKMAGEMTDITINDLPLAKGEIVVIGDVLHVRIAEITGAWELSDASTKET